MAVLLFVLLFVALGVGVLLIAMLGTRRRGAARRDPAGERRRHGVAVGLFVLVLLVLGIGVPAAVIASVESRNDVPEANVSGLTAKQKEGRELFSVQCRNCHMLAASKAVAQVGPNLDQLRPPKALVLDAIENGRARGNGAMAADLVEGPEAEAVADYVAKAVGQPGG